MEVIGEMDFNHRVNMKKDDDSNASQAEDNGKLWLFLILGVVAFVTAVSVLMAIHLAASSEGVQASLFSYSKQDLGTVGDFLGGIINPILAFLTIFLLVWSINLQLDELRATKNEMKRSADAQENTSKLHEKSLLAQERTIILPFAKPQLEDLAVKIYEQYQKKINYLSLRDFTRQPHEADAVKSHYIGSCRNIALSLDSGRELKIVIDRTHPTEYFPLKLKQLRKQIKAIEFNISEYLEVASAMKRVEVDEFLYIHSFRQITMITSKLLTITKAIGDDGIETSLKIKLDKLAQVSNRGCVLSPASDDSLVPFINA